MAQKQYPGENDGSVGPDTVRGVPPTQYSSRYGDGEPLLADGDMRELRPDGWDSTCLTPEALKRYGQRDHEDYTLLRNHDRWGPLGEPIDRPLEWMNNTPGGRIPLLGGKPIPVGDLVVAFFPKHHKEEREAEQIRATEAFDRMTPQDDRTQNLDRDELPDHWETMSTDRTTLKERQHQRNKATGMIGEFPNIKWTTMKREMGDKAWNELQARFRSGDRHVDVQTREQEQRMAEARGGGGGAIISVPSGVRPKNTMAAAARRRA